MSERFFGRKSVRKATIRGNPKISTRMTVPKRRTNSRIVRRIEKRGMRYARRRIPIRMRA